MEQGRLSFLAALLFALTCQVLAADSVPIMPGEHQTGEIQAGEQDAYALSADAGDVLTIFVGVASGSLDPHVELHGPDGAVVATGWGSSSAVIETTKVAASGTYLILVRDHYGQYAGAYGLTVITNPGPNPADEDASEIVAGQYKTADIAIGDVDVLSYHANAGDVLTIFVGVASGSLDPQVELHGPDGAVVATGWGSSSAVIETTKVAVTGTHLILVRDHYGQYAGAYGLTLITNPGPNPGDEDAGNIIAGQYKTANITAGDIDAYSYQARAGDTLTIFVGVASGSLDPQVELHGPDGAVVSTEWGSSSAEIGAVKVTMTGTYLILVRDHYGQYTGAYGLTVITNPGPNPGDGDGWAIRSGQYAIANIAPGDMDVYNFWANAGDAVTIVVDVNSGSLDPQVELHSPDGAIVSTDWGSSSAEINAAEVAVTGTHLIVVRDHYGTYTGQYILSFGRVKTPGTPTVGTVLAEPDIFVRGEDLTLRAENISDANGTIVQVEFWYDYLWDGYLETDGSDVLLGVDSNGVDGWSWSGSTREFIPSFFEVVFARAVDDEGLWSDEMGAILWVLSAGDLNGDLFTDALDLQDFTSRWLQAGCTEPDWCGGADINHSGAVDLEDLAELGWDWLR